MAKISNVEIPSLLFNEQGSDPATPAAGFWRVYAKSTGLFLIDDAGAVTGPFSAGDLAAHLADTTDAHDASAISADSTTLVGTGTDVQAVLEELDNGIADHLADATDAHDASAISIVDSGAYFTGTDVEAALQELGAGGGGGATELGSLFTGMDNRSSFESQFGADEGYDEEFDGFNIADDTLPTNWSMLNQDTSVYRQSFGAGRVDWGGGGDASNLHAAVRTLPATTTFDAFFHLWGATDLVATSTSYIAAVVLYNSANGDFIYCGLFQNTSNAAPQFFISHFTDADTQGSTLATGPVQRIMSPHIYFRITKQADNNYDFYGNCDGGCWFTIGANLDCNTTLGADPTHIGFALNTVGAGHVGCEWFRLRDLT